MTKKVDFEISNDGDIEAKNIIALRDAVNDVSQTGLVFTDTFDLSTGGEVYYEQLELNTALTPKVSAIKKVGSGARLPINAGSGASLVLTNLGTKHPDGDENITASKLNEVVLVMYPEGMYYKIKVLN